MAQQTTSPDTLTVPEVDNPHCPNPWLNEDLVKSLRENLLQHEKSKTSRKSVSPKLSPVISPRNSPRLLRRMLLSSNIPKQRRFTVAHTCGDTQRRALLVLPIVGAGNSEGKGERWHLFTCKDYVAFVVIDRLASLPEMLLTSVSTCKYITIFEALCRWVGPLDLLEESGEKAQMKPSSGRASVELIFSEVDFTYSPEENVRAFLTKLALKQLFVESGKDSPSSQRVISRRQYSETGLEKPDVGGREASGDPVVTFQTTSIHCLEQQQDGDG
ncbi:hypothetical protein MJT46_011960 [Ovis ammon polii x Ovis aries]|nr:hypothetical protein MJT46_011960 [Ovis ammon polii x Ovis aries]